MLHGKATGDSMSIKSFKEIINQCISPFVELVEEPDFTEEEAVFILESKSVWIESQSVLATQALRDVLNHIASDNGVTIVQDNGQKFTVAKRLGTVTRFDDLIDTPPRSLATCGCKQCRHSRHSKNNEKSCQI